MRISAALVLSSFLCASGALGEDLNSAPIHVVSPTETGLSVNSGYKLDEVIVNFNTSAAKLWLVVWDRFLMKETEPEELGQRVEFSILDGVSERYGDCRNVSEHPFVPGDPFSTWVNFEFGNRTPSGERQMTVARSMDFQGLMRVYEFSLKEGGAELMLDPGISITIVGNDVKYTQVGGLIGPKGRGTLEISFSLFETGEASRRGAVRLDSDLWSFSVEKSAEVAAVNDIAADKNRQIVVAPPVRNLRSLVASAEARARLSAQSRSSGVSVNQKVVDNCIAEPCSPPGFNCVMRGCHCAVGLSMCATTAVRNLSLRQ